jgi:hypothetical protein
MTSPASLLHSVKIFTDAVITYVPAMHALFSKYLKGGKHPVKIVFPLGLCEPVEKTFADNQP